MGDADLSSSINLPEPAKAVIAYADIYKDKTVYIGPRKLDDESQAEFTYGDGTYVQHFMYKKSSQDGRRGGDKAAGSSGSRDKKFNASKTTWNAKKGS
jgi:hypothetical protein